MNSSAKPLSRPLLKWYDTNRRDLPWRVAIGDDGLAPSYHVLISEVMLQQTQVATVIPYFKRFLLAYPTLQSLANSNEQDVLKLWQGLGYYSRARNLRQCAIDIVNRYNGNIPKDVPTLLTLKGIGRYTAGAISSIAFDQHAPILDGNVMRVLCRLDAIQDDPRDKKIQLILWQRAEEILPKRRTGDFNSALMELGATVCTPRNPSCLICPLKKMCKALDKSIQNDIPPLRKIRAIPTERRRVFCINYNNMWLIEQRPSSGRWAGLWQFVTRPESDDPFIQLSKCDPLGSITHLLTHRRYEFEAYLTHAKIRVKTDLEHVWVDISRIHDYPMSKPQLEVLSRLEKHLQKV